MSKYLSIAYESLSMHSLIDLRRAWAIPPWRHQITKTRRNGSAAQPSGRYLRPMDGVRFDEHYMERRSIPNGSTLVLRLVRPSDATLLLRGFERLSIESRYRRFFTPKKALSPAEVKYFTECDGINHFAIGALVERVDGSEEGVGIARFVRVAADPCAAEAALTIIDDCQHKGIGRLLLERLLAAAAERGLRELRFSVVAANGSMLDLLRRFEGPTGRSLQSQPGRGVVEFIMPVQAPEEPRVRPAGASVG